MQVANSALTCARLLRVPILCSSSRGAVQPGPQAQQQAQLPEGQALFASLAPPLAAPHQQRQLPALSSSGAPQQHMQHPEALSGLATGTLARKCSCWCALPEFVLHPFTSRECMGPSWCFTLSSQQLLL